MRSKSSDTWIDDVRRSVADACAAAHLVDFAALLRGTPGLPPEEAVRVLWELVGDRTVGHDATRLIESASTPVARIADPIDDVLPVPHPLDHEWRFDRSTRRELAARLAAAAGCDGHVLVLGCPTVTHELLQLAKPPHITLIDSNPALPRLATVTRYAQHKVDLRVGLPAAAIAPADACIADPPFYPDHIQAFIAAASAGVRAGAQVLLVLPPSTARPSAAGDVDSALATAQQYGLHLARYEGAAVTYLRPPFERNAHQALGLHGVPDDWRVADLFVLERDEQPIGRQPVAPMALQVWEEVVIGRARIRVLIDPDFDGLDLEGELLQDVVPGGVLDSVSGRDPRRALANVWTDGNVVWSTHHPALLIAILRAAAADRDPFGIAEAHLSAEGGVVDPERITSLVAAVLAKVDELG